MPTGPAAGEQPPHWGPPGAPPYGAGYPGYPYGYYPPPRPHNGLAIASLVVSLCSAVAACLFYGLPGLIGGVGAILGHMAQKQIKQTGEQGSGLALTGIIVGWIMTGLALLAILLIAAFIYLAVQSAPPD